MRRDQKRYPTTGVRTVFRARTNIQPSYKHGEANRQEPGGLDQFLQGSAPETSGHRNADGDAPGRIYVIGSIYMDVVMQTPRFPQSGQVIWAATASSSPAGRGVNQAVAAARAGGRVTLISVLGDDAPAAGLRNFLEAETLDLKAQKIEAQATGVTISMTDGTTSWIVDAGNANLAMTPDHVANLPFSSGDVLLLQNEIPHEVSLAAAIRAKSSDAVVIWNMAPFRGFSPTASPPADIWVFNRKEFASLCGRTNGTLSVDECRLLLESSTWLVRNLIVTLDVDGALASFGDSVMYLPTHKVNHVDSIGAGDCFCGVLAAAIANHATFAASLEIANMAAALSVQKSGAAMNMPYRAEIEAALDERLRENLA